MTAEIFEIFDSDPTSFNDMQILIEYDSDGNGGITLIYKKKKYRGKLIKWRSFIFTWCSFEVIYITYVGKDDVLSRDPNNRKNFNNFLKFEIKHYINICFKNQFIQGDGTGTGGNHK